MSTETVTTSWTSPGPCSCCGDDPCCQVSRPTYADWPATLTATLALDPASTSPDCALAYGPWPKTVTLTKTVLTDTGSGDPGCPPAADYGCADDADVDCLLGQCGVAYVGTDADGNTHVFYFGVCLCQYFIGSGGPCSGGFGVVFSHGQFATVGCSPIHLTAATEFFPGTGSCFLNLDITE